MLPEPLHPVVVHFPIVFAALLPFVTVGIWALTRRSSQPAKVWVWVVVLAGLLSGSAWIATQTGESQEDRVESVVPRSAMHGHEEAGERFLLGTGAFLLLSGLGLARGSIGRWGRVLTTAASFAVLASAVQVGGSGGELVYEHGAGSVYAVDSGDTGVTVAGHEGSER